MSTNQETFFAITTPGLEELTAKELQELGAAPQLTPGGVQFAGDLDLLYRANLHLRTASRILVRIASFKAFFFSEVESAARKIPWSQWASKERLVGFRVSCHKSKLYHSDAVKERFEKAFERALPGRLSTKRNDEDDEANDEQLFFVRLDHDVCTVSVDSSGALLHQRGYRQATAKAPLRETLAAAMIMASQWRAGDALVDPMCGSGTIPIEAALMARNIPPGLASEPPRGYAFQGWGNFDAALWESIVAAAKEKILPKASAAIYASDQAQGAIDATLSNAARAGVAADLTIACKPLSSWQRPADKGLILTNPPYGIRVGNLQNMREFYQQIGRTARSQFPRWRLALLSASPQFLSQVGFQFEEALRTKNGGLSVQLVFANVPKSREQGTGQKR